MENQDQRELAANAADDFKKICWGVITLFCSILPTYDPLVTHYPKMVAFIITIVIYFSLSLAEFVFRNNGINHVIVTKLNLFVGVLAVILPLLIIVPAVGWLALGMWVCVSGIVVCCSYDEIGRGFVDIYEELMEELRNDDEDEEQPNGMLDENLPV